MLVAAPQERRAGVFGSFFFYALVVQAPGTLGDEA